MGRRRPPRNKKAGRAAKYFEEGGSPFLPSPFSKSAPTRMRLGDEPIVGFPSRATDASPTSPAPSEDASS